MNIYFSVIIPVFNRQEKIIRAVDSVLAQSYTYFELIIVDDGSVDATVKSIENYSDNRIRILLKENGGVSSARNRGIQAARYRYIAFLDSDDQWLPDKLAEDALYIIKNPATLVFQSDEIWIRNGVRVNKKKYHEKSGGDIFEQSLQRCMISPSAVVISRECFNRFGYFDEEMKVCEDYDLWLRLLRFENAGFIDRELVIKFGGDADQLSRSVTAMDRFRLYTLFKLYIDSETPQNLKSKIRDIFLEKVQILINGAKKRGNIQFRKKIISLKNKLDSNATLRDAQFLLQE